MQSKKLFTYTAAAMAAITLTFLQSCSSDADEQDIPQEAQLSQEEFQAVLETEEWTGVADTALAELFQNGNSNSGKSAANECYQAEYTETGFTATFGNCVLNGTENVNGTLVVTYGTDPETASFTAVYDSFYVGDIEVNGTRSFTLTASEGNSVSMTIVSDMTLDFADGSTISESGTRSLAITFGETLADSTFSIEGDWTLLKDGNTYTVAITSPLTGNFECGYLVSGVMTLGKNGLSIIADLGDGQCDNLAILTYPNGVQEEFEL
ncbi:MULTISPECIES: hypothetical protein [Robiginitalea]|uniref:Lipocalin-like domain-containing protein n=1 Tax=Robiginitalea biformata (strain ATCC BAA-864 / DSM 15991 / KCTC 12146 / HTCC2501) TaxID=313596 RepID=A4CL77_ROBBH|nr:MULTISPECIES: hypothetical protein [Robiginitalea]EAR15626.1 hypothetical protein RB2501_14899 [Robiginitalea biformata HTCC2501]MDC6354058.1 hypothetical protein [Robiginitalea sp. PM2]MDC6374325.1 hypothetical protein [Robiginitalea sp. SP8]